jgi:hypothetical protein
VSIVRRGLALACPSRELGVFRVNVETDEMIRTGEAGGQGVRMQFGEIWRIDDWENQE